MYASHGVALFQTILWLLIALSREVFSCVLFVLKSCVFVFLFCLYIGGLLVALSKAGIWCFTGHNFVGALAYADDSITHP